MASPVAAVKSEAKKLPSYITMGVGIAIGAAVFAAAWAFIRSKTSKATAPTA